MEINPLNLQVASRPDYFNRVRKYLSQFTWTSTLFPENPNQLHSEILERIVLRLPCIKPFLINEYDKTVYGDKNLYDALERFWNDKIFRFEGLTILKELNGCSIEEMPALYHNRIADVWILIYSTLYRTNSAEIGYILDHIVSSSGEKMVSK